MLILKSLLFSLYYLKISYRNYLPLLIFLLLFYYILQSINNPLLTIFFLFLYLIVSSPVFVNIFRCIISNKPLENYYVQFFYEVYTKLFIKKFLILMSAIFGIYIVHLMILTPFVPQLDEVVSFKINIFGEILKVDLLKIKIFVFVLNFYMIYIYTRLFFILPAAAMNESYSFKECYFLTKGRSIKIFLYYISLVISYMILNTFITYSFSHDRSVYTLFIGIFLTMLFIVLSASIVAYLYKKTQSIN